MKERKAAKEIKGRRGLRGPEGQRVIRELWALLGCLEYQFLDHLDQKETEGDLGCLDLKENLELLFEGQRVPKALRDQWALQDSKVTAILVCPALEESQDLLDQGDYLELETLEQREILASEALQAPLGLGVSEPQGQRVTSGRKACLALLAPLAMDYKASKGNKDLRASQGQRA